MATDCEAVVSIEHGFDLNDFINMEISTSVRFRFLLREPKYAYTVRHNEYA